MQTRFHAAARQYAAEGQPVFPLHPGQKTPRIGSWQTKATTNESTINAWWSRWPTANIGILCGDRAQYTLAVLDVDAKHGATIPSWAPATLTALTPTGGWHLYYTVPHNTLVRNAVNIRGEEQPGLDVRANAGYVVAPPSILEESMVEYEWDPSAPDAPVAIDPTLLLPRHLREPDVFGRSRWDHGDPPSEVPVGERNAYLASLAGFLYNDGLTQGEVLDALLEEAERLHFTPRAGEIEAVARSIARYH